MDVADPIERLGGSGRGVEPNERRWDERRFMARWNGSAKDELGGLPSLSLSDGVSGRFFNFPFELILPKLVVRAVGDAEGEVEGNQMLGYGVIGMLSNA